MYPNSLSEPHILKVNTLATSSWRAWQPDTLQQSHINRITKNLQKSHFSKSQCSVEGPQVPKGELWDNIGSEHSR